MSTYMMFQSEVKMDIFSQRLKKLVKQTPRWKNH